jgi:hypothetical protein
LNAFVDPLSFCVPVSHRIWPVGCCERRIGRSLVDFGAFLLDGRFLATGELGFTLSIAIFVCYLHCFEVYIFNDGRTNKQKIDTSHRKV